VADNPSTPPVVRAAQYIRMSTEHQQYSTENQADMIGDYAAKRGFDVVRTYADAGKSGLKIEGRQSLQRLIRDVQDGSADFKTILVYDVSRWGRFQDSDESAYYEYICKRAGINVEYCAEQFENDGSPTATIIKSVKRAMAGEYSRELSAKVFKGQCRLIELGYRQGGPAGYGLRRMLMSISGEPKGVLSRGEHKSLQTDRVVLVPGPEGEQDSVRRIYSWFTEEGLSESQIARRLNEAAVVHTELQRPWSASMVHQVLTNEKYIGNNVYNRVSFKLKKKRVRNAPDMWVRRDAAFPPIVEPSVFYVAQGIIMERCRRFSDEELLAKLRELLTKHRTLSAELIDEMEGAPSSSVYRSRFGSLVNAYEQVGFTPERDYSYVEINRHLRRGVQPSVEQEVVAKLEQLGATVRRDGCSGMFIINGEFSANILVARCHQTSAGSAQWHINLDETSVADITIVVRMDGTNQAPADFYLLPRFDVRDRQLRLREKNGIALDVYRRATLNCFIDLAAKSRIEEAA
jgi:DNA invertase Pin-like site-specific DNA recombinase